MAELIQDAGAVREVDNEETEDAESQSLSQLFDLGWRMQRDLEEAQYGDEDRTKKAIDMLERASRMVNELQIFSSNEDLNEVATVDLKFIFLPALLAVLVQHLSYLPDSRLNLVLRSQHLYKSFLRHCCNYGLWQGECEDEERGRDRKSERKERGSDRGPARLEQLGARRQAKIQRYQRRREMDKLEKALWATRAKEGDGADEEQRRQLYLTSINRWVFVACDELESLSEEVRILQHQQSLKEQVGVNGAGPAPEPQRVPVKPFVISKHVAQNRVFGSAYPSLPSMTVVEWYEEHKRKGVLPDQGIPAATFGNGKRDDTKSDEEEEEEDEDSLQRARQWDDWKDTHRRGWGNRQNMG